jgi:hypothetical protein
MKLHLLPIPILARLEARTVRSSGAVRIEVAR